MGNFFRSNKLLLIIILIGGMFVVNRLFPSGERFLSLLYSMPGIIIGISFHEFAHGFVAYKMGDPTPKRQGRLTVSPMAHIDILGLVCLAFAGFGWGRPVETDPTYYHNRKLGSILVSLAGITMNLIIAIIFAFILKIIEPGLGSLDGDLSEIIVRIIYAVILINLVLMVFNLLPVPPLDGFQFITEVFNLQNTNFYYTLQRYSLPVLIILLITGVFEKVIRPVVFNIFDLIQTVIIL